VIARGYSFILILIKSSGFIPLEYIYRSLPVSQISCSQSDHTMGSTIDNGENTSEDSSWLIQESQSKTDSRNSDKTNTVTAANNNNCISAVLTRWSLLVMAVLAFAVGHFSANRMEFPCQNSPNNGSSWQDIPHSNTDSQTTVDTEKAVLVTGATGRTGSLTYHILAKKGIPVRALVRNVTKAKEVLGCTFCDSRDGIFVGDVTQPEDLMNAANGVSTVVILASSDPRVPKEEQRAVEFDGVINSVAALAQDANRDMKGGSSDYLRVVLCSTMGTTRRSVNDHGFDLGEISFWKLNAEAFLATSGVGSTIVKPCGLLDGAGKNSTLVVGHHDSLFTTDPDHYSIPRVDVAAVISQAVVSRTHGLRFDLCSKPGPVTTDLEALLESSKWEWET